MTKESTADYGVALSASAVGQANLAKQTQAFTRNLVLSQAQNQLAAEALAKRGAASVAKVGQQQASATSRYGGALGESAAAAFKQAQATANASADQLTGLSRLAGRNVRTAKVVAGIAKAGVAAQSAAATYALNQALQQRAIIDNQTLAALTGDIYKSALDYNMQWSMWKKQQDYAARQAEREGGALGRSQAEALMGEGGQIAVDAAETWRSVRHLEDEAQSITDLATTWATQNGYDLASPQAQLYIATLRNISNGMTADEAFKTAATTLFSGTPGFEKWGDSVLAAGMGKVSTLTTAAWLESQTGEGGPGSAGGEGGEGAETTTYSPLGPSGPGGEVTVDSETGYVVPSGPTGKGVEATDAKPGVTKSGRAYVIRYGKPWYQDTGYAVPENDLP
jgi:hypothetical protein